MARRSTIRRAVGSSAFVLALLGSAALTVPAATASSAPNRAYVTALYADVLDRSDLEGTPGMEFWANRLDRQDRSSVVRGIMYAPSREYFRFRVDLAFNVFLERSADAGALDSFSEAWRSGTRRRDDLVATLVGSNEFYRRAGETPTGFVELAFFDILGREPDAAGLRYFEGLLASRGRGAVARTLLASPESLRAEVAYRYQSFLERPPTDAELSAGVAQRQQGVRYEAADLALLASDDYFARTSSGG